MPRQNLASPRSVSTEGIALKRSEARKSNAGIAAEVSMISCQAELGEIAWFSCGSVVSRFEVRAFICLALTRKPVRSLSGMSSALTRKSVRVFVVRI